MILSTDSELIAYTCINEPGLNILHRPPELCEDNVASIPVFQHILENFPSDLHLNYNCNFPECDESVFDRGIKTASKYGESLSVPYAVWAQTKECLFNYGDPFKITAQTYEDKRIGQIDIHTMEDLIHAHRDSHQCKPWTDRKKIKVFVGTPDYICRDSNSMDMKNIKYLLLLSTVGLFFELPSNDSRSVLSAEVKKNCFLSFHSPPRLRFHEVPAKADRSNLLAW